VASNNLNGNYAGGSATAGGINFQTSVTALATACLASSTKLGWCDGLCNDVPVAILAETRGAGDDLAISLSGGEIIEVQIKKGLQRGAKLWAALLKLAAAVHSKAIARGVLIVSQDSSQTVQSDLARGIRRMGMGRHDDLADIATEFHSKLSQQGYDVERICSALHITPLSYYATRPEHLDGAYLSLKCAGVANVSLEAAWNLLYRDAAMLLESKGRRTRDAVLRVLLAAGFETDSDLSADSPIATLVKLRDWSVRAHEAFTVFGIDTAMSLDKAWIPLKTIVQPDTPAEDDSLDKAVVRYHSWEGRNAPQGAKEVNPEYLGRFVRHCVVTAGPGMGKSTLLKRLARTYAKDGYPTLRLRLPTLVARINSVGCAFDEGIFAIGLEGSGIGTKTATNLGLQNWVILLDGLDECGANQQIICESLLSFIAGHPGYTVIVATRTIGYTCPLLKNWRHYELLPFTKYDARSHIDTLLRGVLDPESDEFRKVLEFANTELRANDSSELATRSPLLLGFVVSLAIRNVGLGRTKTQLYEKLFQLIEALPTTRADRAGIANSELLRFLEILGWVLQFQPFDLLSVVLKQCASIVATDLGLTIRQAETKCEAYMRYWEAVGMLERLHYLGDETATFVHKTFGEYAAARYLISLEETQQVSEIAAGFGTKSLSEVFAFAASLGLSDRIIVEALDRTAGAGPEEETIRHCLTLIASAEISPASTTRDRVFKFALEAITTVRKSAAVRVAEDLLEAAKRYPQELNDAAELLIEDERSWIRLIGWTLVSQIDEYQADVPRLTQMFRELPEHVGSSMRPSLSGGICLSNSGAALVDTFAVYAIRQLFEHKTDAESVELTRRFLTRYAPFRNAETARELKDFLCLVGEADLAEILPDERRSWIDLLGDEDTRKAAAEAERRLASSLILNGTIDRLFDGARSPESDGLLYLGAFLDATQYTGVRGEDIADWSDPADIDCAKVVWHSVLKVAEIDEEHFLRDVRAATLYFDSEEAKQWSFPLSVRAIQADCVVDWDRGSNLGIDFSIIERALHHPSDWVVVNAANLLAHGLGRDALLSIAQRVLETGKNRALWAGAVLAKHADSSAGLELLLTRFEKPLVVGSRFLYDTLSEFDLSFDSRLLLALRAGLLTKWPYTASAAAAVAVQVAAPGNHELNELLKEAYSHWLEHEEPYPSGNGAVPESPRAKILSARIRIAKPSGYELLQFMTDSRSDVVGIAKPVLMQELAADAELRSAFIQGVGLDKQPPHLLASAIESGMSFSSEQCDVIRELLRHPKARVRYAAMNILGQTHTSPEQISQWLELLADDPEEQIRERVLRLRTPALVVA
jgi:HEAT repeats/NACHT domain